MASTRQHQEPARPYYCHQCSHQWMKSQNSLFECPRCREGFIEEVSEDFNPNAPLLPAQASPLHYLSSLLSDASELRSNQRQLRHSRLGDSRSRSSQRIVISNGDREQNRNDLLVLWQRRNSATSRFLSVAIDDIMSLIYTSERQRTMTDEQLNSIPVATINEQLVEAQSQCAICFDEFKLNENEVRKLVCSHLFHEKCIFPWLKNNASCPVCRTSFASQNDDDSSDDDGPNIVHVFTNHQRSRPTPNSANSADDAGPSTSSPSSNNNNNNENIRGMIRNLHSRRARIPVSSRSENDQPTVSSQTPLTRPQRARPSAVNSPVSSRTRSRSNPRPNDTNSGRIEDFRVRVRQRNNGSRGTPLPYSRQRPSMTTRQQSTDNFLPSRIPIGNFYERIAERLRQRQQAEGASHGTPTPRAQTINEFQSPPLSDGSSTSTVSPLSSLESLIPSSSEDVEME